MSSDPFIGEIMPIGFNFAPRAWALCEGQLLAISSNTALFSLIGTTFGGDGRSTFGLPDLRGRTMVGVGRGPGLPTINWGQKGGNTSFTLTAAELPAHSHTATLFAENAGPTAGNPEGNMLASHLGYAPPNVSANKPMSSESIVVNNTGSGIAVNKRSPFLGAYMCIALFGIYPSRS